MPIPCEQLKEMIADLRPVQHDLDTTDGMMSTGRDGWSRKLNFSESRARLDKTVKGLCSLAGVEPDYGYPVEPGDK